MAWPQLSEVPGGVGRLPHLKLGRTISPGILLPVEYRYLNRLVRSSILQIRCFNSPDLSNSQQKDALDRPSLCQWVFPGMTEFHPPRNDFYSVFPTLHNGHDFSLIEAFYARCLQNNGDTALPSWFRGDTEYTVTDLHAVQRHFDDAARQSLQQRWLRKMDKKKWGNMRDRDYSSNDNGDDSGNGHCSASTPTIPDMPPGLHDRIVHTSLESNIPLITCTNLIETAKNRETYALRISYLGNAYYGYQLQNGKNHKDSLSVQEDLQEHVLRRKTFAAGRTDRYVSAISQVIYFHLYTEKDQLRHTEDSDIFKRARIANILHNASLSLPCMNGKIKVNQCVQMPKPFHSLFSAKWRRYVYLLPMSTVVVIEETKRREMKYLDTHRADKSKCNVHACAGGDGAAGAGGEGKGEDDDEECIDAMGSSNQNLPKGVRMSLDVDFMNDCMSMLSAQTVHCNCFAIKDNFIRWCNRLPNFCYFIVFSAQASTLRVSFY